MPSKSNQAGCFTFIITKLFTNLNILINNISHYSAFGKFYGSMSNDMCHNKLKWL